MTGRKNKSVAIRPLRILRVVFQVLCPQSKSGGREEAPEAYFTYVEEADDDANKVSQRKRNGIIGKGDEHC